MKSFIFQSHWVSYIIVSTSDIQTIPLSAIMLPFIKFYTKKFKQFCQIRFHLASRSDWISVIKKKGKNNYFGCKFLKSFSLHLTISGLVFVFQNVKD